MNIVNILGESAVRTLVLGLAVAGVLRVLRVQHVCLAKRAWTAVLVLAIAMPALVALRIPAVSLTALWSTPRTVVMPASTPTTPSQTQDEAVSTSPSLWQLASASRATPALTMPPKLLVEPQPSALDDAPSLTISTPVPSALGGAPAPVRHIALWQIGLAAYLVITAAALFRTLLGLVLAARLWRRAQPFAASEIAAPVRLSVDLRSPATVGHGILLPLDALEWDDTTLRATLAHEAEHVREGDFYLQLASAFHLCFFWISPLAWWLRPQLARLGETICDRAAVSSSGDGLRYAELLLRFASAPHAHAGMVAMAHTTGLRERIDRLIADPQLAGSFRSRRGQALAATALLSAVAITTAATVHIIEPAAVVLAAPQAPAAPAVPPDPAAPAAPAAQPVPAPPDSVQQPAAPPTPPATPVAPAAPDSMPAPAVAVQPDVVVVDPTLVTPAVAPMVLRLPPMPMVKLAHVHPLILTDVHVMPNIVLIERDGKQEGGYAVVTPGKDGNRIQLHSWSMNRELGETDSILKQHPGGAILFRHEGKTWIIDNPELVKKAKEAFAHADELGKQQGELGVKQGGMGDLQGQMGELEGKLGEEAAKFADQQAKLESENFHFEMPKDFDRDVQAFTDAQVKLGLEHDKLSKEQMDALEKESKEAHDRFEKDMEQFRAQQPQRDAMEKQIREQTEQMRKQMEPLMKQMREQAEKQRELGQQQGELGRQQVLLGHQQREASREADRQVQSLIDQAVKDGSAHPLQ
jgi:beta-lactamase regulating signal transducer with metallopeptidase domain